MTADRPGPPLLTVKHAVPPVRSSTVRRSRLTDVLDGDDVRLVAVVAPAGWGKTSLLGAWADGRGDVAWVSLDESDDDPHRFWSYVLAALSALDGGGDAIGPGPRDALAAGRLDLLLPLLVNALAAAPRRHVLVLDDYHVLTDPQIHEGVEFLVAHLPPTARVVVAGRVDPPLPLARLRARGELAELRASDLRFTQPEAAALVSGVLGAPVDVATAATAWARTEGWAAGLQLAGLALRTGVTAPARDGDHLLDYFTAEVLPALAPRQRDLLVGCAPLDRLSGPLCDAVLKTTGSGAVLASLERAELFVVSLDAGREWYRCHRLLRGAMLRQAGVDPADVLRRAADWFLAHGRRDDAVRHLLAAGDGQAAAAVLDSSEQWFLDRGSAAAFLQLGEALQPETVSPGLALALAYGAATCGRSDRVGHWLDVCDAGITDDTVLVAWRSPRAAAAVTRAMFGVPESAAGDAVALAREALRAEGTGGNPIATIGLGACLVRAGAFAEAADLLADTWERRDADGWPTTLVLQVGGVLGLCLHELGRGDELDRLLAATGPVVEEADADRPTAALAALPRVVEGMRASAAGRPEAARATLRHAVVLAAAVERPTTRVLALVALADAELACGDRAAARAALAQAREIADDDAPAPVAAARLAGAESRIGRAAVRAAAGAGAMFEELTDRELAVLRALPGPAGRRDIGAALNLSINTVKAYTASLYRKLGVGSREDAVAAGRRLGLI
ncbi:LuxR C-terminal-related transcriptional regulator [Pseudonocardia sp.]|uniref:helix-turn-helix transcriptional regulator n=1 Tax=Pseudonocardia sp. TaxID=60912 RepID=UPI003D142A52